MAHFVIIITSIASIPPSIAPLILFDRRKGIDKFRFFYRREKEIRSVTQRLLLNTAYLLSLR